MTIPGGAAGYMLLTGQITAEYTTSTTNLACIYLEDQKVECDEVTYKLENPKLVIEKTVNKTEVNIGDEVTFTLKITNQGDMPMSGFTVTDTLPSELSFVLNSEG